MTKYTTYIDVFFEVIRLRSSLHRLSVCLSRLRFSFHAYEEGLEIQVDGAEMVKVNVVVVFGHLRFVAVTCAVTPYLDPVTELGW